MCVSSLGETDDVCCEGSLISADNEDYVVREGVSCCHHVGHHVSDCGPDNGTSSGGGGISLWAIK